MDSNLQRIHVRLDLGSVYALSYTLSFMYAFRFSLETVQLTCAAYTVILNVLNLFDGLVHIITSLLYEGGRTVPSSAAIPCDVQYLSLFAP